MEGGDSLAVQFARYIESKKEIARAMTGQTLVAVSGGMDSMVLLSLMVKCGYSVAVAHCNFQLRGAQSDADQELVERVAMGYGVAIHTVRFDTTEEMERSAEPMQIVARRLRYEWFEELCEEFGYGAVATAHHADDSAETFFINLLRGTGLRGLTGIPEVNQRAVRPLIFASHQQVADYANKQRVEYRDDESNSQPDYMRNKIRLEVVPLLREINPVFTQTMRENMERLSQAQHFIDSAIEQVRARVESRGDGVAEIDLSLVGEDGVFTLFHLLQPYGFNSSVVESIQASFKSGVSGRVFHSQSHRANLDRSKLLIIKQSIEANERSEILVDRGCKNVEFQGVELEFEQLERAKITSLIQPNEIALLDSDQLTFPLTIRLWRDGDAFRPLGMSGTKRVSDYLIDEKVSLFDKQRQMVVVSDERIVWLVGRRIDDRYKVSQSSENIVQIRVLGLNK